MAKQLKTSASFDSWDGYFEAMRSLAQEHSGVPVDVIFNAWQQTGMQQNPFIQNQRVKKTSSLPVNYTKDDIAAMIVNPQGSERPLRETARALTWSAYPFKKIISTYQALMTSKHYHYPAYVEDAEDKQLWREGRLLDKFNTKMKVEQLVHEIVGQVMIGGKVAYAPRWNVDKSHNQVGYAYLQQLPEDWYKIIGGNSTSKYTIMFDMMYFLQPGTDWRQFGDLFLPFVTNFSSIFEPFGSYPPPGLGKKFVYSSDNLKGSTGERLRINQEQYNNVKGSEGNPLLYNQNGRWAYWVTLPIDKVWVFEADDTSRTAASPLTGLFLAFDQLAALEEVQMAILQNPLVQIALGEIPYKEDKMNTNASDPYKLSPTGQKYFETMWNNLMTSTNTGGIGFFMAPVENFHLESLQEAPNAINISTTGYQYAINKSGLPALLPTSDNPRAGLAEISASIEERYAITVYYQFKNMMNSIYEQLGLKHEWRFELFGGLRSDVKELETSYKGMHEGILSETFRYFALRGMSIWQDMSMSRVIKASGLLDLRLPMISSYSISDKAKQLPPKSEGGTEIDVGGRPQVSIEDVMDGEGSEGQEDDLDFAD